MNKFVFYANLKQSFSKFYNVDIKANNTAFTFETEKHLFSLLYSPNKDSNTFRLVHNPFQTQIYPDNLYICWYASPKTLVVLPKITLTALIDLSIANKNIIDLEDKQVVEIPRRSLQVMSLADVLQVTENGMILGYGR